MDIRLAEARTFGRDVRTNTVDSAGSDVRALAKPPHKLAVIGSATTENRFGNGGVSAKALDVREEVSNNRHGGDDIRGYIPHARGNIPVSLSSASWDAQPMSTKLVAEIKRRMKILEIESMKELSDRAGLKETYVKDIFSGKSKNPTGSKLKQLAEKGLGCTLSDLMAGGGARPPGAHTDLTADNVAINELDVHIAAGTGTADDAGGLMAAHEASAVVGVHTYPAASFREAYGMDPKRIKILPVRGTSMEPELWAGQRVMVDIEDKTPSPPGIFVVWDGLGLVLKFVEVVANSEPLRVRISSAHQAFKAYERNLDEAYINGRVVGVWKRM